MTQNKTKKTKMITGAEYEEITDYVMAFLYDNIFNTGLDKSKDFSMSLIESVWNWEHVGKHKMTHRITKDCICKSGIDLNAYK